MSRFSLFLAAAGDPADPAAGGLGDYTLIIWLIIMAAVFYFILWRPQKKREKQEKQLRASIQPGDTIVTIGGFVGRVLSVKDDEVVFETGADRTKLTIKKYAIQSRTPSETAVAKEEEKNSEKAE